MNRISKSAAAAMIAISAGTLLVMAEPASAAPHHAEVNYCMSYDGGATDCSFTSKAQCDASASGRDAECYRNVYGKEGDTLHW
jgi:basic membrane lipoprotein Med (substrate-binding protein (PBP1-ABC) superfamily)